MNIPTGLGSKSGHTASSGRFARPLGCIAVVTSQAKFAHTRLAASTDRQAEHTGLMQVTAVRYSSAVRLAA